MITYAGPTGDAPARGASARGSEDDVVETPVVMPGLWDCHTHLVGMTDLEEIEAATANGPETLGPQAPMTGRLRNGYDGDVITLDTNPLDERSVRGEPDRVTGVWQRGVGRK